MLSKSNSTNMTFRKVLKYRIFASIILVLAGLKSVSIVLLNQVDNLQSLTSKFGIELTYLDFMKGFYTVFGLALIVVGKVIFFKSLILLRDAEKFKKAEIKYTDERNRFISSLTFSTASYIFLVALAIAIVAFGMINLTVFRTLACTLVFYLAILSLVYTVVRTRH